jgi:hypothetical protein
MDSLSDSERSQADGAVFFGVEVFAPWGLSAQRPTITLASHLIR